MANVYTIGTLLVELAGSSKDLDDSLKTTQRAIAEFAKVVDGWASRVESQIENTFKAAAVAVGALGAVVIKTGSDFDAAMTRVAAITGATDEEFAALNNTARQIGRTTTFSAEQAAEAMYTLSQAGFDTQQIMASVNDVLVLAGASGISLDDAAGLVASTLTEFNMSAEQSGRVVDLLNTAAQRSLLSMQDLRESLKYAGAAGATFNISLEETLAAVAQFKQLGQSASQTGTAFRTVLVRLADPPAKAAKVLERLGIQLDEVNPQLVGFEGAIRRLADSPITAAQAFAIFGRYSGAAISSMIDKFRDGTQIFDKMISEFESGSGSARRTFEQMQASVAGQFSLLRNKVTDVFLTIFAAIEGPLKRLIDGLGDRVTALSTIFKRNTDSITSGMNKVVDAVLALIDKIITLTPYLKEVAALMVAAWVGAKGVQFVIAIQTLASTIGVNLVQSIAFAAASMTAFEAASLFLTGGAIVVGIGVIIVVLQKLIDKLTGAADEAAKLQGALTGAKLIDQDTQQEIKSIGAILDLQKQDIQSRLDAGLAISGQEKAILELTDAQAYSAVQAGDYIVVNNRLTDAVKAPAVFIREQIGALNKQADAYQSNADALGQMVDSLTSGNATIDQQTSAFDYAANIVHRHVDSLEGLVAVQTEAQNRADTLRERADNLTNSLHKQQVAATDAAAAAKRHDDAIDRLGETEGDGSDEIDKLNKKLQDQIAATDEGYAAQLKLARALDEINEAEAKGADHAVADQARAAAWAEFGKSVGETTKQVDMWQARAISAELQTEAWTAAQVAFNDAIRHGKTYMDALTAADDAYNKTIDDSFSKTESVSNASTKLTGALGDLAGAGFDLIGIATQLTTKTSDQIIGFFLQFTDILYSTTAAVTDLSSVLDFAGIFDAANNDLTDWQEQLKEAKKALKDAQALYGRAPGEDNFQAMKDAQIALNELLKNKPAEAGDAMATAIQDRIDWVKGFVKALPKMIKAFDANLPALLNTIARSLPSVLNGIARSAKTIIASLLPALTQFFLSGPLITFMFKLGLNIMEGFIRGIPKMVTAIIKGLPDLIDVLIRQMPRIIMEFTLLGIAIIDAVIDELPHIFRATRKSLIEIANDMASNFVEITSFGLLDYHKGKDGKGHFGLGKAGKDTFGDLVDFFKNLGGGIGDIFSAKRHARGIAYVPHTMTAVLEPGESVLDRAATRAAARGTYYPPAGPVPSGAPISTEVLVAFDGQVVDAAMARALDAGRMPKLQRAIRGKGVQVGFTRGRSQVW